MHGMSIEVSLRRVCTHYTLAQFYLYAQVRRYNCLHILNNAVSWRHDIIVIIILRLLVACKSILKRPTSDGYKFTICSQ